MVRPKTTALHMQLVSHRKSTGNRTHKIVTEDQRVRLAEGMAMMNQMALMGTKTAPVERLAIHRHTGVAPVHTSQVNLQEFTTRRETTLLHIPVNQWSIPTGEETIL